MKVPFPANNHQINYKLTPNTTSTARATTFQVQATPNTSPYEPNSVLDLRRSPSPKAHNKPDPTDDPLQLEDHVLINPNIDDWDSLMRELGLHDDPAPVSNPISRLSSNLDNNHHSPLPDFTLATSFDSTQFVPPDFGLLSDIPNYGPATLSRNPNSFDDLNSAGGDCNVGEFDYVDELIRLAESFEINSLQLSLAILARLNQRLKSPTGKPLQRAAFYFKETLQSLLTGSTRPAQKPASSSEIVQTINAQNTFSNISPVPMFASFTANQIVLEAIDGSMTVHVIDFEIGLGGHWASFMKELADRSGSRKTAPPMLRISALVPDEYAMESRLVRENLTQFARELNIRFDLEFVLIKTFKYLSFKSLKFVEGEKLAVLLSPAIFRHIGTWFLNDLRRMSPHVVVHVDIEGQVGFGTSSYRQAVIEGLEFYSTLLESLEAADFNGGGGGEWMRRIEMFVLFPKIMEGVEAAGRRGTPWRKAMAAAGMRQVGLSQFADFQAECLLRRVQVRGFHVIKRQAEMLLCWHDRPLVATSAWRYYSYVRIAN